MATMLATLPPDAENRKGWPFTEEVDPEVYSHYAWLPKITVITPSYNQAAFLEETLRSVLMQNYPNLEFLVLDGGSNDGSVGIIEKYAPWLTYWVSEKDRGTYDADNKGLERMTGDYWLVLNSDDILLPDAFLEVVKLLNETREQPADWITSGIWCIDEFSRNRAQIIPRRPRAVAGYSFGNTCWIYHPCTFLSAKVYQVVGKFRNTDVMDYDYWVRMEELDYHPVVIQKHLAGLRFHTNCKSYDYLKIMRGCITTIDHLRLRHIQDLKFEQIEEFNKHIAKLEHEYAVLEAKTEIVNGRRMKAMGMLMSIGGKNPGLFARRWFWGAVRRVFTGMQEREVSPHTFLFSDPDKT